MCFNLRDDPLRVYDFDDGDEQAEHGAFSPQPYGGSPVQPPFLYPDCDQTYQQALAAGAKSVRVPVDQPYGDLKVGLSMLQL
jgi:PhnB protein